MRLSPAPVRSRTRGARTATGPRPVMIARSGRWPWRTSRWRPSSVCLSAWPLRKAATSASTACANRARAPSRRTSVSGSENSAGWPPFAQNCTLSGAGPERGGNIPEWPQAVGRLSGVPIVLARERDVLPAERRDVGEQFVGDNDALGAEVLDGTVEIDRVPVDDGCRQQAQPRSPEALVLERAVAELALAVEEHGPA